MDFSVETLHHPPKICLKLHFYLFTATHSEKSKAEVGNWGQTPVTQVTSCSSWHVNHLPCFPAQANLQAGYFLPLLTCKPALRTFSMPSTTLYQHQILPHKQALEPTSSRSLLSDLPTSNSFLSNNADVRLMHRHLYGTALGQNLQENSTLLDWQIISLLSA
jgi:hypothetical protein